MKHQRQASIPAFSAGFVLHRFDTIVVPREIRVELHHLHRVNCANGQQVDPMGGQPRGPPNVSPDMASRDWCWRCWCPRSISTGHAMTHCSCLRLSPAETTERPVRKHGKKPKNGDVMRLKFWKEKMVSFKERTFALRNAVPQQFRWLRLLRLQRICCFHFIQCPYCRIVRSTETMFQPVLRNYQHKGNYWAPSSCPYHQRKLGSSFRVPDKEICETLRSGHLGKWWLREVES